MGSGVVIADLQSAVVGYGVFWVLRENLADTAILAGLAFRWAREQ
jgi:hypothetical protein